MQSLNYKIFKKKISVKKEDSIGFKEEILNFPPPPVGKLIVISSAPLTSFDFLHTFPICYTHTWQFPKRRVPCGHFSHYSVCVMILHSNGNYVLCVFLLTT